MRNRCVLVRITAERKASLASVEARPETNLATFEATINPEGVVCRFNNETKEYWLPKARCSPWVTSAADNLDHIPDAISVVLVGMQATAVGISQVLCRARAVVDALPEPQLSARTRARCSHTLCNSAPALTNVD